MLPMNLKQAISVAILKAYLNRLDHGLNSNNIALTIEINAL
jgi:hypothetical protein